MRGLDKNVLIRYLVADNEVGLLGPNDIASLAQPI